MIDILISIILMPFAAIAAFTVICLTLGVLIGIWDAIKKEPKEKNE